MPAPCPRHARATFLFPLGLLLFFWDPERTLRTLAPAQCTPCGEWENMQTGVCGGAAGAAREENEEMQRRRRCQEQENANPQRYVLLCHVLPCSVLFCSVGTKKWDQAPRAPGKSGKTSAQGAGIIENRRRRRRGICGIRTPKSGKSMQIRVLRRTRPGAGQAMRGVHRDYYFLAAGKGVSTGTTAFWEPGHCGPPPPLRRTRTEIRRLRSPPTTSAPAAPRKKLRHIRGGTRKQRKKITINAALPGHTHINKMTKAAPQAPQSRKCENMCVGRWSQDWPLDLYFPQFSCASPPPSRAVRVCAFPGKKADATMVPKLWPPLVLKNAIRRQFTSPRRILDSVLSFDSGGPASLSFPGKAVRDKHSARLRKHLCRERVFRATSNAPPLPRRPPFYVAGLPFYVVEPPFYVVGPTFYVARQHFYVAGPHFYVVGPPFSVVGPPFNVDGLTFYVDGSPSYAIGPPFSVVGPPVNVD
eukprot:gene22524-biopygen17746